MLYEVVETEAGFTIVEREPGVAPEEAAVKRAGVVVDPGPYKSYEDAYDAILALQEEEEEDELP